MQGQANTANWWFLENNYLVEDNSPGDNFIYSYHYWNKIYESFLWISYLTEGQLKEFSENSGLSLNQILRWFNKKRTSLQHKLESFGNRLCKIHN